MARRILKRPPPFLFRYRPPDEVTCGYLEGLLRENHIWASPPRGFTDWHDCRAQIDFKLTKEEVLRYWRQVFKKLGLKGKAASRKAHSVIANDAWKDPGKHAEIIKNFQGTLDNSGVICLTDTALDERMWAEYASGHRGICLCFETSGTPFSSTHDVNYAAELPMVKINANSKEHLEAFLLTKGASYSWESEWRFVDYNKGGGYKPIPPKALRAIVLGSQTEEMVRQEVVRLVAQWKPDVMLFAVDATGTDVGLRPLDGPQVSTMPRIIPPIQERCRSESVWRPNSVRLLDYLESVSLGQRQPDLDRRIEVLAARLKAVELFQGKRTKEVEAEGIAAVREAIDLLSEIVDRSGVAIPGYGEVAVLLYELVHGVVIKPDLRLALKNVCT